MSLDSFEFLLFLPVAFILYWMIPAKAVKGKNVMLVALSYAFYGYADWRFCFLLLAMTTCTYLAGRWMYRLQGGKYAKTVATSNVVLCLGVLGIFKYLGFFVQQIEMALGGGKSLLSLDEFATSLIVPLGVSFYCFMAVSYTIDCYRRKIEQQPTFLEFAAYLSFFPHLLAGPIDRGREMLPQLQTERTFSYDMAADGMRRILCGLFKKTVIADNAALMVNGIWGGYENANSLMLLFAAVLYSVQIYADFSGYSDMAIGVGRLFGLKMRANFAYPYFARNVSEFWRGWHMSLTTWFTEYLYIPLGGSRCGTLRTIVNTLIVFTLCGLWHGANWTYVAWGFLCGALFIPLLLFPSLKNRWKGVPTKAQPLQLVHILFTFALITLCWVFFRAPSITEAFGYLGAMATNLHEPFSKGLLGSGTNKPLFLLLVVLLVLVEWRNRHAEYPLASLTQRNTVIRWATYFALTFLIIYYTTESGAFIYQNF